MIDLLEKILRAIQWVADFFGGVTDQLVNFVQAAFEWCVLHFMIGWVDFKIWTIKTAWSIASSLLESFGLSDIISSALSALPPDIAAAVNAVAVPEALSTIVTAGATRFALRFIPGA